MSARARRRRRALDASGAPGILLAMANLSDYLENAVLGWLRGNAMPAPPATVYLALYSVAPTDAGGGTELTGAAWARQPIPLTIANPTANATPLTFPDATAAAVTAAGSDVVAVGIFDAANGGNLLAHGALAAIRHVDPGERFVVDAGGLSLSLA